MNMPALGGYFRALREGRHITRTGLAGQIDVDPTTLWRIEEGKQEPGASILIALTRALYASVEDMNALITNKNATREDAERLAHERLVAAELRHIGEFATDPATAAIAQDLVDDPAFWAAVERAAMKRGRKGAGEPS
jgi:transcriptional regulator with XRE-family HTH domain